MTVAAPQRTSKEQFDKQAAEYDSQWNEWSKETTDWLLAHSDAKLSDTVLDVATGTGFTALAFAPRVGRVTAVDVSEGMLDQARRQAITAGVANIAFSVAAAESLPFDDASFDLVVCRVAAHHFLDIPAFAAESFRVLKCGGRLLVADTTVPDAVPEAANWQNRVEALRDPSHVRNYSPSEWRDLLTQAGFQVEACTASGSGITIPLADWIRKAGCMPDQAAQVREEFRHAPRSARDAFAISGDPTSDQARFTWMRVLIRADNPASPLQ